MATKRMFSRMLIGPYLALKDCIERETDQTLLCVEQNEWSFYKYSAHPGPDKLLPSIGLERIKKNAHTGRFKILAR